MRVEVTVVLEVGEEAWAAEFNEAPSVRLTEEYMIELLQICRARGAGALECVEAWAKVAR